MKKTTELDIEILELEKKKEELLEEIALIEEYKAFKRAKDNNPHKVLFYNPVKIGDQKLTELSFKKPIFKDVRLAQSSKDPIESQNALIRTLAIGVKGITNDELDNIPWEDYKQMQEVVEGFL